MVKAYRGFTLIELMVAVSVAAILLVIAVPSFTAFFDRARLRGAADDLVAFVSTVRGEAVKTGRNVTLSMGGSTTAWCVGANEAATPAVAAQFAASTACDCTNSSACFVDGVRRVLASSEAGRATASAVTMSFVIDGKLGSLDPLSPASVILTSPAGGYQLQVGVSPLGQARACVPSGQKQISGYPSC